MKAKLKNWFSSQHYLNSAFAVSLVMLGFLTYICYQQIEDSQKKQNEIIKSLDARIELERIYSELKGLESAYRGYMLTNDSTFIRPFTYSQVKIMRSVQSLQRQFDDSKTTHSQFSQLDSLLVKRFRHLRLDLAMFNASYRTKEESSYHKKIGMDLTEEIRELLNKMIEQETIALQTRNQISEERSVAPISFALLVIFSLATLFTTFYVVRRSEKNALQVNQILSNNQKIFNYSEKIGNMAHWYQYDSNAISYSENYWNLLKGVKFSPGVPIQEFINAVHRKDRALVRDILGDSDKWKHLHEIVVRIFVEKSEMRYYRISSQTIINDKGERNTVGVICDVTAEQRAKVNLEKQYNELVKSNAELSSFNHIVSHDLQEPLRKIQMFVSRIDLEETRQTNKPHADILERVHLAAARAQALIDDLLSYTRLNREDRKTEKISLTALLEHVKIDLQQLIEENKAEIISEELPEVQVVPYQIEQIFLNLITNSIKYRKVEIAPLIKISCQKVMGHEISEWHHAISNRAYYKLEFKDNGIGFEQQYASKIFVIFKRLHPKETYAGTGIGLAICKKMIENHKGYISAKGETGIGAVFTVYLPVI